MIEPAWKSGEEYGNGGCRFVGFEGKAGIEGIVVVVVGAGFVGEGVSAIAVGALRIDRPRTADQHDCAVISP